MTPQQRLNKAAEALASCSARDIKETDKWVEFIGAWTVFDALGTAVDDLLETPIKRAMSLPIERVLSAAGEVVRRVATREVPLGVQNAVDVLESEMASFGTPTLSFADLNRIRAGRDPVDSAPVCPECGEPSAKVKGSEGLRSIHHGWCPAVDRALTAEEVKPIPMRLHCPSCHTLHVDAGEFATKAHHTHACQACGAVWRPAVVPTVGVQFLPGFKDAP